MYLKFFLICWGKSKPLYLKEKEGPWVEQGGNVGCSRLVSLPLPASCYQNRFEAQQQEELTHTRQLGFRQRGHLPLSVLGQAASILGLLSPHL